MNTRISMGMMLELARMQPHRRLAFLSPLDTSMVIKGGNYMKIIKMDNPESEQVIDNIGLNQHTLITRTCIIQVCDSLVLLLTYLVSYLPILLS